MFKKSRWTIVASIMAVLALLFLGTLAIIYGSSYYEVSTTNKEMLRRYAEMFSLEDLPGEKEPYFDRTMPGMEDSTDEEKGPRFKDPPVFSLSTFYSVAISDHDEILAIDNEGKTVYTDEQLKTYAFEIIKGSKKVGTKGSLLYLMEEKEGYTLVAFIDNTIIQKNMITLFRHTFLFGGISLIALFFVAVYLSKRIVKPLEESHQKQKQFISDAGHELKTPISVISANTELLARQIGENPWLDNIRYENERMGNLVGQLLELAKTEHVLMRAERMDLSRLTRGEALPFESVAFEKGMYLTCQIEDELFALGNSEQWKQLVSILLDNALHHHTMGKEIALYLTKEHHMAKLSVINDGEMISLEQQELLFERFYRLDPARNGETQCYGLGLAIAKAIVTAHKGTIEVNCQDGKVAFVVRIPLQKK